MSISDRSPNTGGLRSRGQETALDLARLENVREGVTKTTAACPACHEAGNDKKGVHLAIFPGGHFACVLFPGQTSDAKAHRQRIYRLAGKPSTRGTHRGLFGVPQPPARSPAVQPFVKPLTGITLEAPPRLIVRTDEELERLVTSLTGSSAPEVALAAVGSSDDTLRWLTVYAPPTIPVPAIIDVVALRRGAATDLFQGLTDKILVVYGGQEILRLLTRWNPEVNFAGLNFWCAWIAAKLISNGLSGGDELEAVLQRYLHLPIAKDPGQKDDTRSLANGASFSHLADRVRHLLNLKTRLDRQLSDNKLNRTFALESRLLPVTLALNENGWWIDLPALRVERERLTARLATSGVANRASLQSNLTQVDSWLNRVGADGRLRCKYNALGAVTGRFSAREPNLQSVPCGSLRKVFGASAGCSLVIGDLSQIELRIAALVSGDWDMLNIFRRGKDLHRLTAAAVLRKAPAEVGSEDRQLGKTANFGLIFGQGVAGFVRYARGQGVDLTETRAARIRDRFFETYLGIAEWHRRAWDRISPRTLAVGKTAVGRRRLLPNDTSEWEQFQAHVNYMVQGSAADLLKTALVEFYPQLQSYNARLIGVVHDEVILEVPSAMIGRVTKLLKRTFEQAFVRLFNRVCENRFQKNLPELFQDHPACEVQTYVCMNWAAKR